MELKKITRIVLPLLLIAPLSCFAAGLGDIQVDSSLNQPFDAVIPVIDLGNVPPEAVKANLASEQEFESVGLTKDISLSTLEFTVLRNKQQQTFIQVTTVKPVSQPVMTFLLQLRWPGGQILREYTVFLDPSNYGPVSTKPKNIVSTNTNNYVATPAVTKPNTYGPTTGQDNLWEIANQNLPNNTITTAQMMIAIVQLNPHAFVKNNINGLKSGYVLKLPSASQASAMSDADAQEMISQQNQSWQTRTQTTVLPPQQTSSSAPPPVEQPDESSDVAEQSSIPSAPMPSEISQSNAQQNLPPPQNTAPSPVAPTNNAPIESVTPNAAPPAATPMVPVTTLGQESDSLANEGGSAPTIQALENEVNISTEAIQASATANQSLQQEVKDLQSQVKTLEQQLQEKNNVIGMLEKMGAEQATNSFVSTPSAQTAPTSPGVNSNGGIVSPAQSIKWYFWPLIIVLMLASIVVGIYAPWKKIKLNAINDWLQNLVKKVKTKDEEPVENVESNVISAPQKIPQPVEEIPESTLLPASLMPITTDAVTNAAILDIVDEADVYIAYGRYEKAETLLKNSLLINPTQPELRVKLLEIYIAQNNKQAFDEQIDLLSPLPELPATLQNKVSKLLGSSEKIGGDKTITEDKSLSDKSSTMDFHTESISSDTVKVDHSNRVMEFDGDLSTLYPDTKETVDTKSTTSEVWENILDDLKLEEQDSVETQAVTSAAPAPEPEVSPLPEQTPILPTDTTKSPTAMVQTNLDLAKAYYDMGDFVEALGILQAILQEGDEKQMAEAQALINKINNTTSE